MTAQATRETTAGNTLGTWILRRTPALRLALRCPDHSDPGDWRTDVLGADTLVPQAMAVAFRHLASLETGSTALGTTIDITAVPDGEPRPGLRLCAAFRIAIRDGTDRILREERIGIAESLAGVVRRRILELRQHKHLCRSDRPVPWTILEAGDDESSGPALSDTDGVDGFIIEGSSPLELTLPRPVPWSRLAPTLVDVESVDSPATSPDSRNGVVVYLARDALESFRSTFVPDIERGGYFTGQVAAGHPDAPSPLAPVVVLDRFVPSTPLAASSVAFTWNGDDVRQLRQAMVASGRHALAPAHTHVAGSGEVRDDPASDLLGYSSQDIAMHTAFHPGPHELGLLGDASRADRPVIVYGWSATGILESVPYRLCSVAHAVVSTSASR